MPTAKINFSVEIDDKEIISHSISHNYREENKPEYIKFPYYSEYEFAVEVIKRMNNLYTTRIVSSKLWPDKD